MSAIPRFAMLLTLLAAPAFALAQDTQQDTQPAAQDSASIAPNADTAAITEAATPAPEAAVPTQDPAASVPEVDPPATDAEATATEPASAGESAEKPAIADAASAAVGGKIGAPQAGKGQIVFFRPSKFAGAAVGFKVREGTTELGKLRSGKYFVASVEPGTHEYTVHSESEDVLTLEVEAGETYYVQGTLTMGLMVGRPNLSPSDEATFNGMADKLKLAK